jgi:hypothetical protein
MGWMAFPASGQRTWGKPKGLPEGHLVGCTDFFRSKNADQQVWWPVSFFMISPIEGAIPFHIVPGLNQLPRWRHDSFTIHHPNPQFALIRVHSQLMFLILCAARFAMLPWRTFGFVVGC